MDFDFSESFQSCQCGHFSNNPRLKHCPRCGKILQKTDGYFEVHLRPDTSILKDKVLKYFIDRVLIPFWEIGLTKCDKGFRIIDSAEIWKSKVKSFEQGELIQLDLGYYRITQKKETNE